MKIAGLIGMIDQAITSAMTFLTAILIGRICSPEELGLYSLAFSAIVFAMILQGGLLLTPYTIFSARLDKAQHVVYMGSTLIHQLCLSLMAAVIVLIGTLAGTSLSRFLPFRSVGLALAGAIGFVLLKEYVRRLCFANLEYRSALALDLLAAAVQLFGLCFLLIEGALSARSVCIVTGLSCGSASVGYLLIFRTRFNIMLDYVARHFWTNVRLGTWVSLSAIAWAISTQLYPWFLGYLKDLEAVGVFSAASNAVAIMSPLLLGLGNIVEPALSRAFALGGTQRLRREAIQSIALFSAVLLSIGGCICLYRNAILQLLYGSKYNDSGPLIAILTLNTLIMALNFVLSRVLFILDMALVDFKCNLASTVFSCTLGLFLVFLWGPVGAALGLVLANLLGCPFRFFALHFYNRADPIISTS